NKTMAIIAGYPFYRKGPVNKAKTKVRYACSTPHCKTTVYAQVVQCNGLPVEIFPDITENDVPAHHHSPPLTNAYWERRFLSMLREKTTNNFIRPAKDIYRMTISEVPVQARGVIPLYE
ncbi:hypothetical protein FOZ63_024836, partial [Perkinsus olseni]